MYRVRILPILAATLLAAPTVLAVVQDTSIADFIKGSTLKPSLKFAEVDAGYKALKIKIGSGGGEGMFGGSMGMLFMSSMAGGGGGGNEAMGMMLLGSLADLYWSKAETVTLSGKEFLVAYKLEFGLRKDLMNQGMSDEPPFAARLRLTLIRTDMVASIAPDPDTDIKSLQKLLDEAKIPYDKPVMELDTNEATSAAILYPVFAQAKSSAKKTSTISNAKQLALGMLMYSTDWDDVMPWPQGSKALKFVIRPYTKNDDLWKSMNPAGGEFKFNMSLGGVSFADIPSPAETPMFFEPNTWPDGSRVVAFTDGHVKAVKPDEWERMQPLFKLKAKKTAKKPLPLNYGT